MLEWYPNVVSDEALKGLKKYKYSAVDLSPISKYILSPYWTWAATLFPIWMAPNLITLTGFFFVLFNFICMFVFIPDMETAGPSWCYFSFGIGLFLYSTFDNVDGKQARRTNSSSPLGELFDHGVDALNCTTGALIQCAGLGLGLGNYAFLTLAVVSSAFFFSTWETFYTGTLFLGEFNGPTEGLLITISCLFLSGYFGPQIWKTEVASILPFLKDFIGQVNFGQALILFAIFTLIVYQIPFNAKRAVQACEEKKIDPSEAFVNAVNYLIYVGAAALWFYTPESVIIPKNTIVFLLAFGIGVARLNAMIVLAHVTHTEYPSYQFISLPFQIGAAISRLPPIFGMQPLFTHAIETFYIYTIFFYLTIEYCLWATKVVEQFCAHLKINCFSIPYKNLTSVRSPSRTEPPTDSTRFVD